MTSEDGTLKTRRGDILRWETAGEPPWLSDAARRAVRVACACADRYADASSGLITNEKRDAPDLRGSLHAAIAFLLSGEPERVSRGRAILDTLRHSGNRFIPTTALLTLHRAEPLLDDGTRRGLQEAVRSVIDVEEEDIMAGRNINIPLQNWTARIGAGLMFNRPDLVEAGATILDRFTDMVAAHGSSPEFNSPTYDALTLQMLRIICLLGEPSTSAPASRLEQHLWTEIAWRFHPRLRQICGPWSRAYQDSLAGASGNMLMLTDLLWGACYDEHVAYQFEHAHDHLFAGPFILLAQDLPVEVSHIALEKRYPLTVTSSAEQVVVHMGDDEHTHWVPGGIADLTTWMDEDVAVGTASRSHLHGMYNATYLAQWTRTGQPVAKLDDLGQAYTRLSQNGRRPGQNEYRYRNHHRGKTMVLNASYWGDDGRPFALQSGPTALIAYVLKGQERWHVRTLEVFVVVPRLDTVDDVLVDGRSVHEYKGGPASAVVVRSGNVGLGLRFAVCDQKLCDPRLLVERTNDHLLVGLKLVKFDSERELPETEYRRYGAVIGAELRCLPDESSLSTLVHDMTESELSDHWRMATQGGPREIAFRVGDTRLYGRFEPIAETWLRRDVPAPAGDVHRITWGDPGPT